MDIENSPESQRIKQKPIQTTLDNMELHMKQMSLKQLKNVQKTRPAQENGRKSRCLAYEQPEILPTTGNHVEDKRLLDTVNLSKDSFESLRHFPFRGKQSGLQFQVQLELQFCIGQAMPRIA